jgi:FAD/FMN-containing dehydrogenase
MWLTGKLVPDHKTIADFRRDNGTGIRKACAQFMELCRRIGVLKGAVVAVDGSKRRLWAGVGSSGCVNGPLTEASRSRSHGAVGPSSLENGRRAQP